MRRATLKRLLAGVVASAPSGEELPLVRVLVATALGEIELELADGQRLTPPVAILAARRVR